MDMGYILLGALLVLGIPIALVVWVLKLLRRRPPLTRQQAQVYPGMDEPDPGVTILNQILGEDEVKKLDERYGKDYKMALLDDILWEDVDPEP